MAAHMLLAAGSAMAQCCVAPPPGIVSWWSADSGDGTDLIGNNPAAIMGGVTFLPGEVGLAFGFDGSSGFLAVPASYSLDVGAAGGGFTIECWINPTNIAPQQCIAEWNDGLGNIGVHFFISSPGYGGIGGIVGNVVGTDGSDNRVISAPGTVIPSAFQHVAFTYDQSSGDSALYYNGQDVATTNYFGVTPQTSYELNIGERASGGGGGVSFFGGQMDEVTLYGRALSASEVQAIFYAGTNGKCKSTSGGQQGPPAIEASPVSQTVHAGSSVTFSVGTAGCPLTYQWLFNDDVIPGATNAVLTLTNVQPDQYGYYSVSVTNSFGYAVSSNAFLKVVVIDVRINGQAITNGQYIAGDPASVQLVNAYANGDVFYSLDGTQPSAGSTLYTGPFSVATNAVLQAVGYNSNFLESGYSDSVAIYILPKYQLSITPSGGGAVSISPNTGFFLSNAVATVVATPLSGWTFLEWLGDTTGFDGTNEIIMDRNKSIGALFGTSLSNTTSGGAVVFNPAGGFYPYGTSVQVTALPQTGKYFVLWGGNANGSVNPLNFVVTGANQIVSALFAPLNQGKVALCTVAAGDGQVGTMPQANFYTNGQSVTVTATPGTGKVFLGWSGNASGNQNPLVITLNQSETIYANFSTNSSLSVHLGPAGLVDGLELDATGEYGVVYKLQSSTNLTDWTTDVTYTNVFGTLHFIDYGVTNFSRQFYRSVVVP